MKKGLEKNNGSENASSVFRIPWNHFVLKVDPKYNRHSVVLQYNYF